MIGIFAIVMIKVTTLAEADMTKLLMSVPTANIFDNIKAVLEKCVFCARTRFPFWERSEGCLYVTVVTHNYYNYCHNDN